MNVTAVLEGKVVLFIASAKIRSARGGSHHPAFMYNCSTFSHTFFSLIYPVGKFSFKGVKTWGQSKISSYCFVFVVNQEN